MNISIKVNDAEDKACLDGFALVTGWSEASGIKKSDWVAQKVSEFIVGKARMGFSISATETQKATYITAVTAARAAAVTAIEKPPVVIEAGLLGVDEKQLTPMK
jgi:hypothetical protein